MFKKFMKIVSKLIVLIKATTENGVSKASQTRTSKGCREIHESEHYSIPLRFYDLESWGLMRNALVDLDKDRVSGTKSRFDVPVDFLEKAIDAGKYANVMAMKSVDEVNAPPRYTVEKATVVWNHSASRGLPMFLFRDGALLWPGDVSILPKSDYEDLVSSGEFIESGVGVFHPNSFTLMSMLRSFSRVTPAEEAAELKRLFDVSGVKPDEKFFISGLAVLAGEVSMEKAPDFDRYRDSGFVFNAVYNLVYKPLFSE